MYLDKSNVGLIVVGIDLVIVVLLFALIAFLRSNQEAVSEDIDAAEITASDFTVEIRNLPVSHMTEDEVKANLWQWIEGKAKTVCQ